MKNIKKIEYKNITNELIDVLLYFKFTYVRNIKKIEIIDRILFKLKYLDFNESVKN